MTKLISPEFLYFDLGQVLLSFNHRRMYQQLADVTQIPEFKVRELMVDHALLEEFETGQASTQQVYQQFCERTESQPEFHAWILAISDIFSPIPEVVSLVVRLRAAGHRMGILSNTNDAHWSFLTDGRFPLVNGSFDHHVLSFEVGAMKPDPRIYAVAAERANVPPEKIFFVDDREENVEGASAAGWQVELMTTPGALRKALRARGVRFPS